MAALKRRILVVQIAALGYDLLRQYAEGESAFGMPFYPCEPVFPAVTCTAQASLRTNVTPAEHGIVCNGWFRRQESKVDFWSQSARLLPQPRIWDSIKQSGGTVGTLFMQQSLGDDSVDVVLSPAPIHKHSGGIIQDCYSKPDELYKQVQGVLGKSFNLFHYWGPLASIKATRWITSATMEVMRNHSKAPDLLLTYLPHMDYVLQKHGPLDEAKVGRAFQELKVEVERLLQAADKTGYDVVLCSDYAMHPVNRVVYPNRVLRQAGFFGQRTVRGRTYPDLYASPALAVCDHQVAHIYVRDASVKRDVRGLFEQAAGVAQVIDHSAMAHENAGDLLLVSDADAWFAYPWWDKSGEAPDYASHVDIHNKIGFDPCELFFGNLFPPRISQRAERVRGSHGRTDLPVFFATTMEWGSPPDTYAEMTQQLADCLRALS